MTFQMDFSTLKIKMKLKELNLTKNNVTKKEGLHTSLLVITTLMKQNYINFITMSYYNQRTRHGLYVQELVIKIMHFNLWVSKNQITLISFSYGSTSQL
jgi:hypothetical protein